MSPIGNYQRRPAGPLNGPCSVIVRAIEWVPVLFIFGVVCWSYYAYVIQLCFFAIDSIVERLFCLVLYHVVIVLFLWSYYQTVFTSVLQVPKKFYLPQGEWEKLQRADSQDQQKRVLDVFAKDLPITNRTVSGSIRYCDKCRMVKPDRTHHCSVCTMCVPKMDHHCPWVNNCVSYTNYKFFILFLGYALLYCVYVALTTLRFFILFWEGNLPGGMGRFHILFLFFVSVMFAISLVSLFGYHIYLVSLNRTTLESFRAPIFRSGGIDKNGYNLGRYNNFEEVFGERRLLWFFPIFTSLGDGIEYPVQTQHQPTMYESMSTTPPPNVHRIEDDDLTEVVANRNVGEIATNKPSFNLTQADVQNGSNKLHSVNQ